MIKRLKQLTIFAFVVATSLAPMLALNPGQVFATSGNCYFEGVSGVRSGGSCSVANTDGDYGTNDVLPGRNTSGGCTTGAARGCAIAWGTSKAGFVTLIRNYYNSGGRARTGAGLIIQSMLIGVGGSGHSFPKAADESAWESLVMDSTFTYERVGVTNTTWYDPGKNNVFFDSYSSPPRPRDVLTIRQNGRAVGRIEVDCGNMTAYQDSPFKWGPMSASSVARDAAGNNITGGSIAAGQTIYWTHTVTDDGVSGDSNGSDPTPKITGDIIWGGNTGLNGTTAVSNTYSRSFSKGDSITRDNSNTANVTRTTTAADAAAGNRYCQRINGDSRASWDLGPFSSTSACVLVVPPPKVTPGTSINPDPVGIGEHYTATATLNNSQGLKGNVTATWRTWLDNGDEIYGAGDASVNGPTTSTVDVPTGLNTFGTYGGTADGTHVKVCTSIYNITGNNGTIVTAPSSTHCAKVAARPYFNVLGGDVAAGAGFGAPGVAGASIIGTNNNNGLPPNGNNYNGASAQLAALALGSITSFTTSENPNGGVGPAWTDSLLSGGGYAPSALAFANTGLSAPCSGTYGGCFNQGSWQVQDYYGTPVGQPFPPGSNADVPSGTYTYSGGLLTLNASTISTTANHKIVLYVNGSVYIHGNITYGLSATKAVGSPDLIPQFELIVKNGNIYVDPSVTELDGFYAAEGDGSSTGRFVSCATSAAPIYNVGACNTSTLNVYGAVAAQKVILNRTYGDINGLGIPQVPGETIRFSPLLWVPSAIGGSGVNGWQSVTSLPPIL